MPLTIGRDVPKETLVLANNGGRPWTTTRTPKHLTALVTELRRLVLEPSGGYEQSVLAALPAAHLPVSRVNPREVRHFARASRTQATADCLDAEVLALRDHDAAAPDAGPAPGHDAPGGAHDPPAPTHGDRRQAPPGDR